jgi:hypothetical protein
MQVHLKMNYINHIIAWIKRGEYLILNKFYEKQKINFEIVKLLTCASYWLMFLVVFVLRLYSVLLVSLAFLVLIAPLGLSNV